MLEILNLFIPLLLQILILYFLSQAVDKLVLRRLGRGWYLAAMWPGVMVHELSHFVGCVITFTRVHRVRLLQPSGDTLGFVEHERTRNPVKMIVISIAPLFGVTAVIWLLTKFLFPELYASNLSGIQAAVSDFTNFKNFFAFTVDYLAQYWNYIKDLFVHFDLSSWQAYVFIYLMLSLSSHAAPSKVDLKHTSWNIVQLLTKPVFMAAYFLTYGILFAAISLIIMSGISLIIRVLKR